MSDDEAIRARKGRGAASNRSGRFEAEQRVAFDDGWGTIDEDAPKLLTVVKAERTASIITSNQSPDVPFDKSINPYKGCEHGCIYCFARPTHAYLGLSPGLDFESHIFSKPDAAERLRETMRKPGYECETIAIGANTDPYQPVERRLQITRELLDTCSEFNQPVGIITKSNLILRDIDILADMAERNLASVMVSVTTLDRTLARRMEPRAATPQRRIDAIRALSDAGIPVGVLASPMIPAINDAELERILEACAAAGARSAGYILVRLPLEIKELFEEWLRTHYPDRADRVLDLIRQTRGGNLYDSRYGIRMKGTGPYAELLRNRFDLAAKRLGLAGRLSTLDSDRFERPPKPGDQLGLFDP
jgi:DNA repair photolyase